MKVTALAPAMGAEITGLDLAKGDFKSGLIDDIRAVWLEHHLLVLRDQNLSPQRQLELARAIGEPDIYPFLEGLDGFPEITSVLKREDETVNFGGVWHTDTIYQDKPPMATMLQAVELPPIGGDTLFANQHLAWDRLSDGLKQTLSGLRVICTAGKAKVAASRTARIAEKGKAVDADAMQASHPVVRTHPETGRKSLSPVPVTPSGSTDGPKKKAPACWPISSGTRFCRSFSAGSAGESATSPSGTTGARFTIR